MTWMKKHWIGLVLCVLAFSTPWMLNLRAQTGAVSVQYPAGDHTLCVVVPTTTAYCYPNDGMYQSIKGAAFTQVGIVAVTGVSSFNGRTGAFLPVPSDYPSAVTSVNGKTGAVILSATTTVN
jgi:hypothetical protein